MDSLARYGAASRTLRIPRGFLGMGIWWDYLFYGEDDRLLGFRRRFVD